MNRFLDSVPFALVLLRLLLVPAILLLALYVGADAGLPVVVLLLVAALSDIFDGVIARRRGVATPRLRKWDSNVDLLLGVGTLVAAWLMRSDLIAQNLLPIGVLLLLEGITYLISFLRFGKGPSNHAYLTKLWGVSLLVSIAFILGWGITGVPFLVMLLLGFVAYADGIAILSLIPEWQSDIPSAIHAARIRRSKFGLQRGGDSQCK